MSRLDELIAELCPYGVEYKRLGSFATVSRGGNFQKKDFTHNGVPCVHYGQIYTRYGLFADTTFAFISKETAQKQKFAKRNDIIMAVTSENIEDVCKCIGWLGESEVAVSGHAAIIHHHQDPKYLTYWFHTEMFFVQKQKIAHGTKVIEVTPDKLLDVVIPIPPLPVQREIVKILDNFTELTAELTAELSARQKQYEYYRDCVIKQNSDEICWMPLAHVANLFRGKYITQKDTVTGNIPVILGGQEPAYYINEANHEGEIVVVARSGASAGFVSYWNEPIFVTDGFGFEAKNDLSIPKYLYYSLKNIEPDLNAMKRGAGVPHVNGELLGKVMLPIPSLEEQYRIVSILDRFDGLCNNISNGLPAEIAARQRQYEYYRDKLLTFKPLAK